MGDHRIRGGDLPLSDEHQLRVSEIFASIQGEGPSVGETAVFLRLATCNLDCVWCDTAYSWDWERFDREQEEQLLSIKEVAQSIAGLLGPNRLLILTGGEPLLQQRPLAALLALLQKSVPDLRTEVETNGTIAPTAALISAVRLFVVSPKLANSGVLENRRIRPQVLARYVGLHAALKFVVTSVGDVEEVDSIVREQGMSSARVWLMPEGTTAETVTTRMKELVEICVERGYNLSPRLQILLWGDARGV